MSYRFISHRYDFLNRSDGAKIYLLPKPYCERCAEPIHPSYAGSGLCYHCYNGKTQVDQINLSRVYAASVYISHSSIGHNLSEEIKKCKHDLSYTEKLAEVLEHAIKKMYPELRYYNIITYPPRGSKTARENHIEKIADILSARVGIRSRDLLYKLVNYPSQQTLSREKRIENVRDKIGCKEYVDNQKVIVIDDVYTTGATLLNSAKALKRMGARKVVGLVLGRAVNINHLLYIEAIEEIKD